MKAAVIFEYGKVPQYADVAAPTPNHSSDVLINIKAAAIKNIDRSISNGSHYASQPVSPGGRIIGSDGVGLLADGTPVYGIGDGMIAGQAVVKKERLVKLPENLDYATAAALPNAVMGSAMGLLFRARMQAGDTVLINGATGVTGRIAVQLARHYGAGKIIATGRNAQALESLRDLGADELVILRQTDDALLQNFRQIHALSPIDIVIDYLWGRPAELLLATLKGNGMFTHRTRFVSIGSMAGETIQLPASILRSVDLQLSGSGLGSWTKEDVSVLLGKILPETFQLAADGKLTISTTTIALKDIETVYDRPIPDGERLVVMI
jgi:NADPH:quinone reductase-like Zn-dependent oxidoreductase